MGSSGVGTRRPRAEKIVLHGGFAGTRRLDAAPRPVPSIPSVTLPPRRGTLGTEIDTDTGGGTDTGADTDTGAGAGAGARQPRLDVRRGKRS